MTPIIRIHHKVVMNPKVLAILTQTLLQVLNLGFGISYLNWSYYSYISNLNKFYINAFFDSFLSWAFIILLWYFSSSIWSILELYGLSPLTPLVPFFTWDYKLFFSWFNKSLSFPLISLELWLCPSSIAFSSSTLPPIY